MQKVTVRVPDHVLAAYDRADGNRSELMRRALARDVADGEVEGVPDDLRVLAERERVVADGKLPGQRAKFREKAHSYVEDRWQAGATPPEDLADTLDSWRGEAALYGREYVAFVDALADWYRANWSTSRPERPSFPEPRHFIVAAEPGDVDLNDALVSTVETAREHGADAATVRETLSGRHPEDLVERAVSEVYDAATDGGEPS